MLTLGPLQALTSAPEDYDYGWMRTVAYNVASYRPSKTEKGEKSLRLVQNVDKWHFDQQVMRYGSGLCVTITDQARLDDEVKYGHVVLNENPTPVFYVQFDMKPYYADGLTEEKVQEGYRIGSAFYDLKGREGIRVESSTEVIYLRIVGQALYDEVKNLAKELGGELKEQVFEK